MKQDIINILMKHSVKGIFHATLSSESFNVVANDILKLLPEQKAVIEQKQKPPQKHMRR